MTDYTSPTTEKISTIVSLVGDIGDCDELSFCLSSFIENLTELKKVLGTYENQPPNCKCHDGMDIRGRCCPVRDAVRFAVCPARIDTAWFYINNNHDEYIQVAYEEIQDRDKCIINAKRIAKSIYGLCSDLDLELLVELMEQDWKDNRSCRCLKHGQNECLRDFMCLNCGCCLNWMGYEENTQLCLDCSFPDADSKL